MPTAPATPAPSPRRARRRQERSDAFLDAAMAVVARDGLEGLTIGALARELDAAVGAVYRYFPGKDDVVAALQARAVDGLVAEMQAVPPGGEPLSRLLALLAPFATLATREPLAYGFLDALLSAPAPVHDDARAVALEAHLAPALDLVDGALRDAAKAGLLEPGDSRVRTRVLWSLLHGVGHLRKRDRLEPKALQHRVVEKAALEALLLGFGAPHDAVRAALRRWPASPGAPQPAPHVEGLDALASSR